MRRVCARAACDGKSQPGSQGPRSGNEIEASVLTDRCNVHCEVRPFRGFFVTGPGQMLRACWARPPLGRRSENQFSSATLGLLVRFIRRLTVPRGRQMRHFSFLDLWDHSSRLQWGHNRCQTHVGHSPGNSGYSPPDLQASERGRRHFGARCGNPQDGASPHCRSGLASGGRPRGAICLSPRANPKSSSTARTSQSRPFYSSWRCSGSTSATQHATWGPTFSWAGEGHSSSRGWLARAARRTKRVRQLRKAGAHTRNLTLIGSNAGVLGGSEVLGFTPTQLKVIRVDAAKAICRLSRGQNAATTMMGCRGEEHRSCLSSSSTSCAGLGDGSLGGHSRARLRGQAQPSQAAVVRRHGRSGHFRAHALATRHLTSHNGTKIDLLAVAPKTVGYWVDQASLLWSDSSAHWNQFKGPLFWEAIRPLLVSGELEGWSLWRRNVLVKLVSRGIWTQERLARLRGEDDDSRQLCNEGPTSARP